MDLPKPLIPGPEVGFNPFRGLVSVIIPAYNCAETLPRCIESLRAQTYANTEIIVVDDASADNTREVAARYEAVYIRHEQNLGEGATRNDGARAAKGEVFFFTDADGYYDPDYVEKVIRYLHLPEVGGAINVGRRIWTDRNTALVRFQRYCFQAMEDRILSGERGTGAWAFRRELFDQIGGYDPALRIGTDIDFVWRLIRAGYRTVIGGRSNLYHKDPDTLRRYLRRSYRGGRNSGLYRARWHGMAGWPRKIGYIAAFALMAIWPLYAVLAPWRGPIWLLPFLGVPAVLLAEDGTVLRGWARAFKATDFGAFLTGPIFLYLRRLAIGIGRIQGFFG